MAKWKTQEEKQEFYRRIKEEIKIVDYAYEIGLTPKFTAGNKYVSLREHDSVRIDPNRNCFWRNSRMGITINSVGKGGSIIDFAMEFTDKNLAEVLQEFEEKLEGRMYERTSSVSSAQAKIQEQKSEAGLHLPVQGTHMRNVFAYLTQSRFIDKAVVQEFVDHKMLYQDQRGNCVFVAYDYTDPDKTNVPVFGAIRGTNTERRFLRDAEGSDYQKGFFINNHSDSLIVTESVIEAMSVMSVLKEKGLDYHSYSYLALSGTGKGQALESVIEHNPTFSQYIFALNNDKAGLEATKLYARYLRNELQVEGRLKQWIPQTPGYDWNNELKRIFYEKFGLKMNLEKTVPAHGQEPAIKKTERMEPELSQDDREIER